MLEASVLSHRPRSRVESGGLIWDPGVCSPRKKLTFRGPDMAENASIVVQSNIPKCKD